MASRPPTIQQAAVNLAKKLDKAYSQYRTESGKELGIPPSGRLDFDACSAKYVRKALKYMPRDKPNQDKYMADMLNVCSKCATQGDIRDSIKQIRKKPMSGWICYLKTCAVEEPNLDYRQCMKAGERKEQLYRNHESEWKQEAAKGCPRGTPSEQ